MKLALLYLEPLPGQADDEDARTQANWIRRHLEPAGAAVRDFVWPAALGWEGVRAELAAFGPDVVFNLVEGWPGDDRQQAAIPGLLELSGWAYTGSDLPAIAATTDKNTAKALLRAAGLPTPDWFLYRGEVGQHPALPVICKPAWQDASLGIDDDSVIRDPARLAGELHRRWLAGGKQTWLVETFVEGREFNVALRELEDGTVEVLPPAELVFGDWPEDKPKILTYRAKWEPGCFEDEHTLRRFVEEPALVQSLTRLARECWRVFSLNGYARVDFRQDAGGVLQIIEVNTNPCLSPDAGFMAAVEHAELSPAGVLQTIIQAAVRRKETSTC
ncbi:MAG: D-alanine--D-alanine ligase [Candidatus Firestonebacteria bacterium]|nr:D-alanine--D-alanine ligase [Candidatus Firestonebacteria bacterium]